MNAPAQTIIRLTPHRIQRAIALQKLGKTMTEIASDLGVPRQSVVDALYTRRWPL